MNKDVHSGRRNDRVAVVHVSMMKKLLEGVVNDDDGVVVCDVKKMRYLSCYLSSFIMAAKSCTFSAYGRADLYSTGL